MRYYLLSVLVVAATPVHAQRATLAQVSWLEGCWELNATNRRVVERWASGDGMMIQDVVAARLIHLRSGG